MTKTDEIMALADEVRWAAEFGRSVEPAQKYLRAAVQALEDECFTLAAGQCIVKGGLNGDDHGHLYCALQRENERLRSGGCVRDQRLTQYCAEAAKLAEENDRLRELLKEARQRLDWDSFVPELIARIDAAIAQEQK